MKRYTLGRDRVIDYIGLRGAFPVVARATREPVILRPEDPETDFQRVGWPEFFREVEKRHYAFVYDDESQGLDYRFVPRSHVHRDPGLKRASGVKVALDLIRGLPVVRHA